MAVKRRPTGPLAFVLTEILLCIGARCPRIVCDWSCNIQVDQEGEVKVQSLQTANIARKQELLPPFDSLEIAVWSPQYRRSRSGASMEPNTE